MALSKAPSFPLYVRNVLCSRKCLAMSGDAFKAYWYLICEAWLQDVRATLPNDNNELAEMARTTPEKWNIIRETVLKCFKLGICDKHKGRLYSEKLLEISNKFANMNRYDRKPITNRSQIKRKRVAKKPIDIDIDIESDINIDSEIEIDNKNTNTQSPIGDDRFKTIIDLFFTEYEKLYQKKYIPKNHEFANLKTLLKKDGSITLDRFADVCKKCLNGTNYQRANFGLGFVSNNFSQLENQKLQTFGRQEVNKNDLLEQRDRLLKEAGDGV